MIDDATILQTGATPLLFEQSRPERRAVFLPDCDVPARALAELLPAEQLNSAPLPLPELGERDVVKHYTLLSQKNMSVDTNFYPLGSCTMKYNPRRNEWACNLPGFAGVHPYQPDDTMQGLLELLWRLEQALAAISGLDRVCLQPAAGAHGELTALLIATAHFKQREETQRRNVLIPDSAHGTNPSSAAIAGFNAVQIASDDRGLVDLDDLRHKLDDATAVLMITNPNTLGLFDPQLQDIADALHERGALLYLDGANMNAVLGKTRPGDAGVDLMHFNMHKTFSGPHGAGGPGAGPVAVRAELYPYVPSPTVEQAADGTFYLDNDRPQSIGRVRSFFGNTGVLVRGYAYIRTLGPAGLERVAEHAVLNANYLLARLKEHYDVPYGERCMHEFVIDGRRQAKTGQRALDIAKRLLDYGFHAPTIYFPLIVPEALMIEPTETENKETLDRFVDVMLQIPAEEAELLHQAPLRTGISRPDEVLAARQPKLRWIPGD